MRPKIKVKKIEMKGYQSGGRECSWTTSTCWTESQATLWVSVTASGIIVCRSLVGSFHKQNIFTQSHFSSSLSPVLTHKD